MEKQTFNKLKSSLEQEIASYKPALEVSYENKFLMLSLDLGIGLGGYERITANQALGEKEGYDLTYIGISNSAFDTFLNRSESLTGLSAPLSDMRSHVLNRKNEEGRIKHYFEYIHAEALDCSYLETEQAFNFFLKVFKDKAEENKAKS